MLIGRIGIFVTPGGGGGGCQSKMVAQHWNIFIGSFEVNVGAVITNLPILTWCTAATLLQYSVQ